MYAKFINEKMIEFPPYEKDGVVNYNSDYNAEQLIVDGYKPYEREEVPSELEYPELFYREEEDKIIGFWLEGVPPPEEETNDI